MNWLRGMFIIDYLLQILKTEAVLTPFKTIVFGNEMIQIVSQ